MEAFLSSRRLLAVCGSKTNKPEHLVNNETETVWLVSGFVVLSLPAHCNHQIYNAVSNNFHFFCFFLLFFLKQQI